MLGRTLYNMCMGENNISTLCCIPYADNYFLGAPLFSNWEHYTYVHGGRAFMVRSVWVFNRAFQAINDGLWPNLLTLG